MPHSKSELEGQVEKVRSFLIKKLPLWTPGKKKRRKKKLLSNISPNYPRICRPCHGMSFRFHFTFYEEKKEGGKWENRRGNKKGRRLSCCSCFLFLLSLLLLPEWKRSFCAFSKEKEGREKTGRMIIIFSFSCRVMGSEPNPPPPPSFYSLVFWHFLLSLLSCSRCEIHQKNDFDEY